MIIAPSGLRKYLLNMHEYELIAQLNEVSKVRYAVYHHRQY